MNRDMVLSFARRWIPPGLMPLVRQGFNHFQPQNVKKSLALNKKFHGLHKGERCFILATGPSISRQDLTPLAKEICISVSEFYLHPNFKTISPRYHVEAPMHNPFKFEVVEKSLSNCNLHHNKTTHLFLGNSSYEYSFSRYITNNPNMLKNNKNYINYQGAPELDEYNYQNDALWDISKAPFAPKTVVYSAIQVAAYMGFSEIYLLGCDHDYLKRYFDGTFGCSHFYDEARSALSESAVNSVEYLDAFTLENWFQEYHSRWKQYRLMNEHLKHKGQLIYNATDGGMLDVFPRVKLDEIVCGAT